jgi:Mor family transcriptional regulator
MFKMSELNPKDKTLDEIHNIQKEIYNEDKGIEVKDLSERYNSSIRKVAKEYKINLKVVVSKEIHI